MKSLLLNLWQKKLALFLAYAVAALLFFLFLKGFLFFFLLTAVTAIIAFAINRLHSPFDVSPVLFCGVLVMHFYGPWFLAVFWLFGSILPSVFGGSSLGISSFITLISLLLASSLVFLTTLHLPFVLIVVCVYSVLTFFITLALGGGQGNAIATFFVIFGVNAAYFIFLGNSAIGLGNFLT